MAEKIALMGLSRFSLFPVIKNTTEGYAVGNKLDIPEVQSMTRETDSSETKIYADDNLYLNLKSWNGLNTTITFAEMTLKMIADLGFGEWNDATKTLKWNPQGRNLEFAATFRCKRADGGYRMYRMFSLALSELPDSGMNTKGDSNEINAYQLMGMFTARKFDDLPGEIRDTVTDADLTWLDTITSEGV